MVGIMFTQMCALHFVYLPSFRSVVCMPTLGRPYLPRQRGRCWITLPRYGIVLQYEAIAQSFQRSFLHDFIFTPPSGFDPVFCCRRKRLVIHTNGKTLDSTKIVTGKDSNFTLLISQFEVHLTSQPRASIFCLYRADDAHLWHVFYQALH